MTTDTAAISAAEQGPSRSNLGRRVIPTASDCLLPVAVALWGLGVSKINPGALGGLGLVSALPITYFAGLGILIVSAGFLLAASAPSRPRLALHVGALVLMLYGTAPIVYAEPRYSWLYQHIGVVQYITLHHHLTFHLDLFQSWPGFFALAAWFDKVAGISSPLAVAGWAQLLFNALSCTVLAFALRALELDWRERWLAVMVFAGANWIAQDYFSPQATAFVLSLGIFAIALHWCRDNRRPPWLDRFATRYRPRWVYTPTDAAPDLPVPVRSRRRRRQPPPLAAIFALLGAYAALVVMHELSPWVVAIQLGLLTLAGQIRPRWLSPVLFLTAAAYLAPRFDYVNKNYGLLKSFGKFFSNIRPPSALGVHLSHDQLLVANAARSLSVFVWALALIGIWRRLRDGRPVLVLAVLAVSPFFLLLVQSYGGEAILRVELFSLPWSACLAASAVSPGLAGRWSRGWLLPPAVLAVCVALFLPAYFGADGLNRTLPVDLAASRVLYSASQFGTVFYLDKDFPISGDARYDLFLPSVLLLDSNTRAKTALRAADEGSLTHLALESTRQGGSAYLVMTSTMLAYARAYGLTKATSLAPLEQAFDRSSDWRIIFRRGGTTVYQLR